MRRILVILAGLFMCGGLAALTGNWFFNQAAPAPAVLPLVSLTAVPSPITANVTAPPIMLTATIPAASPVDPRPTWTDLPTLIPSITPPVGAATANVPPPVASLPSTVQAQTHTVRSGETLYRIAQQYGVTVDALRAANNQVTPENLREGATLVIPQPAAAPAVPAADGVTHTVRSGETLFRIAQQYNLTVEEVQAANNLTDPTSLREGATLIIPLPNTAAPIGAVTNGGPISPADAPPLVRTPLPTLTPSAVPTIDISSAAQTHTVQAGETLFRIAQQYGLTVDELLAANALVDPNVLSRGTVLVIPVPVTADLAITLTPTRMPTLPPWPTAINGIPLDTLLVLPPETWDNVYAIASRGRALGRNGWAFSKLGDSTIENPHFLARYDGRDYTLGDFAFLQSAIDHFQGSFARQSVAVQRGLNSHVAFDAMWARDEACPPDVGPLACEIALHNPAVMFIRLGTNDRDPADFATNLRRIVQFCMEQGVIPLLGTKADLRSGTTGNNDIVRAVAAEMHVPLWDFAQAADILPGRGLTNDGIHLTTYYAHDYRSAEALQTGYGVHNLLALMMLERVRPIVDVVNP